MKQTRDVVIDSRIVPVFEGWPSDVKYFLQSTRLDVSTLRVRAGKMQKIVTAEEYLKPKIAGKTRKERLREIVAEALQKNEQLVTQHDYPFDKVEALVDEYTNKIIKMF